MIRGPAAADCTAPSSMPRTGSWLCRWSPDSGMAGLLSGCRLGSRRGRSGWCRSRLLQQRIQQLLLRQLRPVRVPKPISVLILISGPRRPHAFLPSQPVSTCAAAVRSLTYQCPLNTSVFIGSTSAWMRNNMACTRPTASIACNTNRLKAPVSFDAITS